MTLKISDARQAWLKRNDPAALEAFLVDRCAHKDLQFVIAICGKRTGVISHKFSPSCRSRSQRSRSGWQ